VKFVGATKEAAKDSVDQVRSVRTRVRSTRAGRISWRIGVTILGVGIIAGGIVLLPLPGPGWLIIFAGLGLLATEYEWAARLLRYARRTVSRWTTWVSNQSRGVQVLIGFAGLVLLAALVAAGWWVYAN
jgi:uncharacterized protein (TIGR02611 family)